MLAGGLRSGLLLRFYPLQPEAHVYLAVQSRHRGEVPARFVGLARTPVELAEAETRWAMRGRMPSSLGSTMD